MEVSVIGSSQVNLGRNSVAGLLNFGKNLSAKICNLKKVDSERCSFDQGQSLRWSSKSAVGTLRASATAQTEATLHSERSSKIARTKPINRVELFVGLPLDTISTSNTINHARAIATGLNALKLLGVEGVELPLWWGIVEKEAMGEYHWKSYLAIVEMVEKLGLKLHVSLCFHGSKECGIPLPEWVSRIGEEDSGIYFTDRSGQQYKECLSFAVDDDPVLEGKSPVEVYKEFCENFKSAFSPFMGSTITGISISLGPDGELRYPSHHLPPKSNHGAGEFQCYDKNMLINLKQHSETQGNPLWGLGGPHDAPRYEAYPLSGGFFAENGGSWETPYGDFFLSWYSNQLISHGDRILSLATSTFKNASVMVSGKVPLVHSWYRTRSHPAELTVGFYNTCNRDGYEGIAEIFSRNSCKMVLSGLDLLDEYQPVESCASPEMLLAQIMSSCRKHGVKLSGQNMLDSGASWGFDRIKKNLKDKNSAVDLFIYQRMGAYFFSPEHFPVFAMFARGLNQPIRSLDAVPVEEGCDVGSNLHMQTA